MIRPLSLLIFFFALFQCLAACAFDDSDALPTFTASDFSSTLPPEWIPAAQLDRWSNLHACPTEVIRTDNTEQHPYNEHDATITRRLMDIYSWKAFVALNWPTADEVDERAAREGFFVESSGATLAEAITSGLNSLGEAEDNVVVELVSDKTRYKVGITRCKNPNSNWYPPNGSVWAVSRTAQFPSQNQISSANCPRWMTWHRRRDVLGLGGGFTPVPTQRTFCQDTPQAAQNSLSVSALADFNHLSQSDVPGQISDPLIDQNGNKVYYSVSMNDVSYCKLKELARHSHEPDSPGTTFPAGRSEESDFPGSTEIKTAWKVLVPGKDDPTRFINRKVRLPDDGDPNNLGRDCDADPKHCTWKENQIGLVGLHISHKSKFHMEWIWTTFEQIDNAPDESSLKSGQAQTQKFSFYSSTVPHNVVAPTLLTRTQPIDRDTTQLNLEVRQLLSEKHSVLQYYELVGTQYDPCNKVLKNEAIKFAVPQVLRNTVIEPYIPQKSSCIGCHSTAKLSKSCCADPNKCPDSDFSFLASGLNCSFAALMPPAATPTPTHK
ncbi:MAG: hypothetical protein ACLQAT_11585 [Candidatus Binataceae bacterium]